MWGWFFSFFKKNQPAMLQNYSGGETEKLKNCFPKDIAKAQILPIGVVFQFLHYMMKGIYIYIKTVPPKQREKSRGQNVHKTL